MMNTAMMATTFDPYEDESNEGDDGSITEVHHQPYGFDVSAEDGPVGSFRWVRDSDNEISKAKDELAYADELDVEPSQYAFPPYPRIRKSPSGSKFIDSHSHHYVLTDWHSPAMVR